MQYHFDHLVDRRHTNSLKWFVPENELPMWVADMDFPTAPEIVSAVAAKAEQGIYGYSVVPREWYYAIIEWWKQRHGFSMEKEWLMFCPGIIPAISSIIRKFTTVGEGVLVQTPVYHNFFNAIEKHGCKVIENKLVYRKGEGYAIDFADLERKLAEPQTTVMLLCNPHNPGGMIWDRKTLERIGELCWNYHVLVVADEIHCDITDPGEAYIPFASVSEKCRENSVTCLAPTKAFNLAGLQTAALAVPNEALWHKVNKALHTDELAEPNVFAVEGAVAAFTKGGPWLDALRDYLFENKRFSAAFLEKELPQLRLSPSKATYLLWVDCSGLPGDSTQLAEFLRSRAALYVTDGSQYGGDGAHFLRVNIACPRERLADGLARLKKGVTAYEAWLKENGSKIKKA